MNAVVLGSGPAGLLAAHALQREGHYTRILSRPQKSSIGGAQYLHNRVYGITPDDFDFELDFVKLGNEEVYAQKSHGIVSKNSSWSRMPEGLVEGWSLRRAYDLLWEIYFKNIVDYTIKSNMIPELLKSFDLVVSSIPAHVLCQRPGAHTFGSSTHWLYKTEGHVPHDTVVYNGLPMEKIDDDFKNWWHRGSHIDGVEFLEAGHEVPITPNFMVSKPTHTNCDCFPEVMRVGRYGKWQAGVLSDSAYWEVTDKILEAV